MNITFYRSLRTRLIVFLILIILIISGPAVYFTYIISQNNMEERSSTMVSTSMDHITKQFNDLVTSMYKNILVLTTNKELWEILRKNDSVGANVDDILWIRNQISTFRTLNQYIYSIFILDFNKQYVISSVEGAVSAKDNTRVSEYIRNMYDPKTDILNKKVIFAKSNGTFYKQFTGDSSTYDSYAVIVPIKEMVLGRPLGIMVINLAEASVTNIIQDTYFTDQSKIYLVNNNGVIISSNDDSQIGESISADFRSAGDQKNRKVHSNHQDYLVTKTITLYNDWSFISVIPLQELNSQNQNAIKLVFTYIIIVLVVLTLVLIFLIERFFYKPINRLLRQIRLRSGGLQLSHGNTSNIDARKDEIGYIFQNFNSILEEKEELLRNVFSQKLVLQDTKIRLLYTQINPHFLYNTLDNIRWLAMGFTSGENQVSQTIQSLSNLLRSSAQIDKPFVNIEQELQFLHMYLSIQKVRYGEKIHVQWDIAEKAKSLDIMKFILQPLLENAITHGIEMSEKMGYITISIQLENNLLHMKVTDNGVGMDRVKLDFVQKIIDGTERTPNKGIGLRNIYERICLFYGEEAKLTIESVQDTGTSVTVILPIRGGDHHVQSTDSG